MNWLLFVIGILIGASGTILFILARWQKIIDKELKKNGNNKTDKGKTN